VYVAPISVMMVAAWVATIGLRRFAARHVGRIARGINVANAQPNGQGLATVNPRPSAAQAVRNPRDP
jgi:hypothetical protein